MWKVGKIGRGTDRGLLKEAKMESDKKKRRNAVCATTADTSQVMYYHLTGDMGTHVHFLQGVDMKMF